MKNKQPILQLTKQLVKIPSVSSDIAALHHCIAFLRKQFEDISGAHVSVVEHNHKPSLLVQNFIGKHADIILNGHIDVVPSSQENQFEPMEKDGKLFGRGAGDMKGGVAVICDLMKDILTHSVTNKKVTLMITSDEEVGGDDGVRWLISQGYTGDLVLIPDGGAIDRVVYAQKGLYMMTVEADGVSAHSSRPWLGSNAIHNVVNYFMDLRQQLQETKEAYFTDEHRGTTVNFNVIHAGTAINQVPDKALAKFDIRYTEKYSPLDIQKKALDIMPSFHCRLIEDLSGVPLAMNLQDPRFERYLALAKKHVGSHVQPCKEHGASDGRHFAEAGGYVIIHRATCGNIHGADERVACDELDILSAIFREYIQTC